MSLDELPDPFSGRGRTTPVWNWRIEKPGAEPPARANEWTDIEAAQRGGQITLDQDHALKNAHGPMPTRVID